MGCFTQKNGLGALLTILFFLLWVRFYSEIHRIDQWVWIFDVIVDLALIKLIHFDTLMDMFKERVTERLITVEFMLLTRMSLFVRNDGALLSF